MMKTEDPARLDSAVQELVCRLEDMQGTIKLLETECAHATTKMTMKKVGARNLKAPFYHTSTSAHPCALFFYFTVFSLCYMKAEYETKLEAQVVQHREDMEHKESTIAAKERTIKALRQELAARSNPDPIENPYDSNPDPNPDPPLLAGHQHHQPLGDIAPERHLNLTLTLTCNTSHFMLFETLNHLTLLISTGQKIRGSLTGGLASWI